MQAATVMSHQSWGWQPPNIIKLHWRIQKILGVLMVWQPPIQPATVKSFGHWDQNHSCASIHSRDLRSDAHMSLTNCPHILGDYASLHIPWIVIRAKMASISSTI